MSKHLIGLMAGAALALTAAQASAGDGYGDAPSTSPVWRGFYTGAAAGYGIGSSEFSTAPGDAVSFSVKGRQGVITLGYDVQPNPKWVAGIFADYTFGKVEGGQAIFPIKIESQWAAGARLGVLATPSTLIHMSGGYTAGNFDATFGTTVLGKRTLDGYFVGLGVEQILHRNLSLKLDYRFSDYGDHEEVLPDIAQATLDNTLHSVRLGMNWRFN